MGNVLITSRAFGRFSREPYDILSRAGHVVAPNPWPGQKLGEAQLLTLVADADALLCGDDEVTATVIAAANRLKVIAKYGVGYDKIDVAAASARGISVCITPGANNESVADMAFCLLLSAARQVPRCHADVREGRYQPVVGCEVYRKTIGIVGLGRIGKGVARRAKGFAMQVLAFDEYPDREFAASEGVELVDLPTLLRRSDFVSLHVPATAATAGLIGARELAQMQPTAFLVNTARGDVVDEQALYEALRDGKLAGAGLDVFRSEPPDPMSPLLNLPNVVLSPHTAAHTVESVNNMGLMAAENVVAVLGGRRPHAVVNPPADGKGA